MKTKEEILAENLNCKVSDIYSHGWIHTALKSMEEYRSQASELPSDEVIDSYEHDVTNEYGASMSNYQTMSGFKGWEIGMKQMRSIASPLLASKDARIRELEEVVQSLADWSRKYPKGRIYPMSKITMDDELSEIENKSKLLIPATPSGVDDGRK